MTSIASVATTLNGLLLGDGTITVDGNEKYELKVVTVQEEFANWLLGEFSSFDPFVTEEEPHESSYGKKTRYVFHTGGNSVFKDVRERWYNDGIKQIPRPFTITDEVLRMWVVGDGSLLWSQVGSPRWRIAMKGFLDQRDYIKRLLLDYGVSSSIYDRGVVNFPTDTTRKLKNKIQPVPGFKYKFADTKKEYKAIKPPNLPGPKMNRQL